MAFSFTEDDYTPTATTEFPIARIRTIMKADPNLKNVAGDAVFLVARATVRCATQKQS